VSLVVSVTSGYASIEAAAFKFLSLYMGAHDAQLTRTGDLRGGIPESICDGLLADQDVLVVVTFSRNSRAAFLPSALANCPRKYS